MTQKNLDKFFDSYPSPYPFDVSKRIKEGYRECFDLFEEFKLIFPEKNSDYSNISNVLILGCGHVEGLYHSIRNPKINFDCIDISSNAILSAKENSDNLKLKNVNFKIHDITSYSSKAKYDVIFATNVLQYVEDPSSVLQNIYKLLKDDGALILSLPSSYYYEDVDYMRKVLLSLGYEYNNADHIDDAFNFVYGLDGIHPSKVRMVEGDDLIDKKDFVSRYMVPYHQSFSIIQLFNLLESTNLFFQKWYYNQLYYPSALIRAVSSKHASLFDRINSLDKITKWDSVCRIFRSRNDRFSHTLCVRKEKEFEFIEEKLLNDDKSIVAVKPFQYIESIPKTSEKYAIMTNFKKKLDEDEINILDLLKKPKSLEKLLNNKAVNISANNTIDIIRKLSESGIIHLYQ